MPPLAATVPERADDDPDRLQKVQVILDAIAAPAYARNDRFDVIAWNEANTQMFGDFGTIAPPERNIIRRVFGSPYHRRTMLNWEQDARGLVARFRLNYGQAGKDPRFAALIDEMIAASEDFRRMWADHDVTDAGEGVYLYKTRKHGSTAFQHSTLMPEALPQLRIVVYLATRTGGV